MTALVDADPVFDTLAAQTVEPREVREVTNAITGKPLGQVPHCTADDVVAAATRARQRARAAAGCAGWGRCCVIRGRRRRCTPVCGPGLSAP